MTAALTGESPADVPCVFCGIRSGPWQTSCDASADTPSSNNAACPLCALALHLERPRIDEEAGLLWLPEMSQQAINTTMREIHMQLRALGEGLHVEYRMRLDTPDRRALHHARATLADRTAMAAARLGTSAPRELGSALRRLSPGASSRRATLLGGLRLLPLGQFYEGGTDVYPEIVDTWLALAKPASQRSLPVAPNRLFRRR
ncbi:MAG: hypothetical protein J0H14_07035 [Alphaproteobacteria bacterium]|nr:hypothetical protein [Alphaproteobacteria bacterium]